MPKKLAAIFLRFFGALHTLYLSDHVIQLPVKHSLVAEQALKVLFRQQEKMVR
jgi:hypothetical protein